MKRSDISRRRFLGTAAGAVAAPAILPGTAPGFGGRASANDRVTLGVIGLGSRGFNLIDDFLREADAQIVAVCDVDRHHHRDRPWGTGPAFGRQPAQQRIEKAYANTKSGKPTNGIGVYTDYREIIARDDIDAVVVATPDHWHALCTLAALRSGKDVYCEKPVTHLFREGQLVYREVEQRKAIFQTGSQQRSGAEFRKAVELVLNGHIGKVTRIEVGLPPGYDKPMGDATVQDPPGHVDYEFWCGPSSVLPYMRARHHRWWRGHRAYGGGVLMDWIGHHNDIAHWAIGMDGSGPTLVEAINWTYPDTDVYDTPQQYEIRCEYAGGVISSIASRYPVGTKFYGEDGWIFVTRGKLKASDPRLAKKGLNIGERRVYRSSGHARNFLDGVRSRRPCVAPAETAHRSITPGHLGYISHALGRPLNWNPESETIVNDDEANRLLNAIDYRMPWSVGA